MFLGNVKDFSQNKKSKLKESEDNQLSKTTDTSLDQSRMIQGLTLVMISFLCNPSCNT